MKYRQFAVVMVILAGLIAMGARGCNVWADTDSATYELNSEGQTTLYNESGNTVFLPGCSLFSLEKLESGVWIDRGPHVQCIWEGIGVPVLSGESETTSFIIPSELGTWRIHYVVSYGCEEGKPLSEASCDGQEDVYTPEFEIIPQAEPTCGDLGGIDFGMCEMLLGWAVVNGQCRTVSGCGGQGFQFFATELDCLTQCETDCADWHTAYSAEVENVAACTSADQCEALPGTSCGCTRNLVVNSASDLTYFWELYGAMADAGCGIYTTCDCPPADGYVCEEGQCAWNYL
ncbi:MAG: hypothetical protein GY854_00485 [Deltaproteobacteria bacterium]|nr:hypothetical protein [Deltaproteobacteria bacterium]